VRVALKKGDVPERRNNVLHDHLTRRDKGKKRGEEGIKGGPEGRDGCNAGEIMELSQRDSQRDLPSDLEARRNWRRGGEEKKRRAKTLSPRRDEWIAGQSTARDHQENPPVP